MERGGAPSDALAGLHGPRETRKVRGEGGESGWERGVRAEEEGVVYEAQETWVHL